MSMGLKLITWPEFRCWRRQAWECAALFFGDVGISYRLGMDQITTILPQTTRSTAERMMDDFAKELQEKGWAYPPEGSTSCPYQRHEKGLLRPAVSGRRRSYGYEDVRVAELLHRAEEEAGRGLLVTAEEEQHPHERGSRPRHAHHERPIPA